MLSRIRKATPAPRVTRFTWIEARCVRANTASSRVRRAVSARGISTVAAQISIVTMSAASAVPRSGRRRPYLPEIACSAEATSANPLSASPHQ